jgi:RNA polymerase sigma factor (sigma-70 family)
LPELRRRALRLCGGQADRAEELIANTALKALLFMRRSPTALGDPEQFLFVVMRHVFIDSVRRHGREDGLFERGDAACERGDAQAEESIAPRRLEAALMRVIAAVSAMKHEHRRLFEYRFLQDLPYPVIADRMRIDESVARKRVQLMRRRLRAVAADAS